VILTGSILHNLNMKEGGLFTLTYLVLVQIMRFVKIRAQVLISGYDGVHLLILCMP